MGDRVWQHGNDQITEIDGGAAFAGFAIDRRIGFNVVGDIRNVNAQLPVSRARLL